jgi:hypothetical protein
MQVVITVTPQVDHSELRYCLRSLVKYLEDLDGVTVVGKIIPAWLTNVEWIELPDVSAQKQISIKRKIIAALHRHDKIFYCPDDVYLLKHCVTSNFPYLYDGELVKRNKEGSAGRLKQRLVELGKTYWNFDCHYPLVYEKDFIEIIKNFDGSCIIKSAYCNYKWVKGMRTVDAKIMPKQITDAQIENHCKYLYAFSSGDQSKYSIIPYLAKKLPEISKFEVYE